MSSGWTLAIIFIALALLVEGLWLVLSRRRVQAIEVVEDEESVSEYRSSLVQHIVALTKYWFATVLEDDPHIYSNDELTKTFIDFSLESGVCQMQVDWEHKRLIMSYDFYDRDSRQQSHYMTKARLVHDAVRDDKVVAFLKKVLDAEYELFKPYKDLLHDLSTNAMMLAEAGGEELDSDALWASIIALSTAAIIERHPTPAQARAYVFLLTAIKRQHPDAIALVQQCTTAAKSIERVKERDEA